jgi:MFS family permease
VLQLPEFQALRSLAPDGRLLFGTRIIRMFAYGFLSVVLALYLTQVGLSDQQIGSLLAWTLIGDAAISLWLTTVADRIGRRRMLLVGAGLMIFAGVMFAITGNLVLLTLAAIIGTISPSGNEVGPFLPIEQAALPQTVADKDRTQIFAWYALSGSLATAVGSLCGGVLAQVLQNMSVSPLDSYRVIVIGYALLGFALAAVFVRLSPAVEVPAEYAAKPQNRFGLHRSRNIVLGLSLLFMIDAFAGGLVVQTWVAKWFHERWGADEAVLGGIFFGANVLAGFSALAAGRIAARIGLLNTMIFTHMPSNILLILVPLMPNLPLAILMLLARFSISQMDVPTRQSFTVAVVDPDERSAANGYTNVARTLATGLSQSLAGGLFGLGLLAAPFYISGGLKLIYDVTLARAFSGIKPPEEQTPKAEK